MAETMTKKWNRAPLAPERVEEMERYLNKMSHKGWQCCEIVRDELRFVRGEQDEYTYRVQYFYESRDGEKDDYLRTLGETGATLVGEYGEALILRKKTADGAFELYSDLDSKIAALEKRRSHYRSGMLGALVLVLLSGRHAYKAISQYGFSSWLDTQLDSPVYMVLTVLIVAGLLAGGIAGMISVQREVMEEVGLKVKDLRYYRCQPWGISGNIMMGYWCRLDGDDDTIHLDNFELADGAWVSREELRENYTGNGIALTSEMIAEFAAGRDPYSLEKNK